MISEILQQLELENNQVRLFSGMAIIILSGKLGVYEFNSSGPSKSGGTGKVFKGIIRSSFSPIIKVGDYVAVKVLYRELTNDSINILRDEQSTKMKIQHPNLLRMYEFIELRNRFHTVSEWLDGDTLDKRIQSFASLPIVEIRPVIDAIMNGLQSMHEAEPAIIHRDIKPGNIMLCFNGQIKLIDFGTVKIKREGQSLTVIGTILGTPQYASPEQINGYHDQVNATSDVYALGNVLFELFTGKMPYSGTQYEVMRKQVENPLDSDDLNIIPEPFKTAILNCTEKHQDKRFQSIHELREFLNRKGESKVVLKPSIELEDLRYWGIRFGIGIIVTLFFLFLGWGVYQLVLEVQKEANQPSTFDEGQYEQLKEEGENLIINGQKADACNCFRRAEAIIAKPEIIKLIKTFCK